MPDVGATCLRKESHFYLAGWATGMFVGTFESKIAMGTGARLTLLLEVFQDLERT